MEMTFSSCHVTSRVSRVQRVQCLCGWQPLIGKSAPCQVNGVHESSAGGDVMYLIYHLTLHDHLIEGSCEFMGGYVTSLISLVTKSTVIVKLCF